MIKANTILYVIFISILTLPLIAFTKSAPIPWPGLNDDQDLYKNILYLPLPDKKLLAIPVKDCKEKLIDLSTIENIRIKPLSAFGKEYKNSHDNYSKVRLGVYTKLLQMLQLLPRNIGIAYFEGLRPIEVQKQYFDKKFYEILKETKDKNIAFEETTKYVSFIDNFPTHVTGAAIDITLFIIDNNKQERLLNMGKFVTIFGLNNQQATFSENTSIEQRQNRLILLKAALEAGLVNYGFEWWHYSYGDRAWAYVTHHQEAIYGLAIENKNPLFSMDKNSYLENIDK